MTGGRTKRGSSQLYRLGDVFLWSTDTNVPKESEMKKMGLGWANLKHGLDGAILAEQSVYMIRRGPRHRIQWAWKILKNNPGIRKYRVMAKKTLRKATAGS